MIQLHGTCLPLWDDVLPKFPKEVAAAMAQQADCPPDGQPPAGTAFFARSGAGRCEAMPTDSCILGHFPWFPCSPGPAGRPAVVINAARLR